MYFDTHIHFDVIKAEPADVVRRASEAEVDRFVAVGASPEANRFAVETADRFPDRVRAAVGYDRDGAGQSWAVEDLEQLLSSPRVTAIGEIGLDFHYHPETAKAQEELFSRMLELARDRRLPALVHSREAEEATLRRLREHASAWRGDPQRLGALHCFTGSLSFARALVDLGFYISFSGIVTFKNSAALREVARGIPEDRLLIETDSPLLAPEPFRGRPNEPALLPFVARALAEARGCTAGHIGQVTSENANRLLWRA